MTTDPYAHEIAAPVVPDAPDTRDFEFAADDPSRPLPASVGYEEYQQLVGETWHQRGLECTGFALAAIANHSIRKQLDDPDRPSVSRRMLYEMAQLHDGESYTEGSTLRGALKGWGRMGVARDDLWPYDPHDEEGGVHGRLTLARLLDARARRLLRYRRVSAEVEDMRRALAEGHVLFACADYHVGWFRQYLPGVDPVIERRPDDVVKGGHAFVVVGYEDRGFWIHNSFGPEWGVEGYALLPYSDWEDHRHDVWTTEIELVGDDRSATESPATDPAAATATYRELWPHLVVLSDDGTLASSGLYEMDGGSVGTLLYLFQERTKEWSQRRLAVFADGGYWPTEATLEHLQPLRDLLLANEIYPIFVVWETGWWVEVDHELRHWLDRVRPVAGTGGVDGRTVPATDPDVLTAVDRSIVKPVWRQLLRRSQDACRRRDGGGRILAEAVAYKRNQVGFDLHVAAHGAGDLLLGELASLLPAPLTTATTHVPTSTLARFAATYGRLLESGVLEHLTVVVLDHEAESADRTGPVEGSLVGLVAQVLAGVGVGVGVGVQVPDMVRERGEDGAPGCHPMLGLATDLEADPQVARLHGSGRFEVVLAPECTHVGLAVDPGTHASMVRTMLAHRSSPSSTPPPTPPPAEEPDASWTPPRDPLAYAEARQQAAMKATAEKKSAKKSAHEKAAKNTGKQKGRRR